MIGHYTINFAEKVKRIKMASKLSQLNFSRSAQYLKAIKNPKVWTHYHETQVTSLQISLQFYLPIFFFLLAMATKAVVAWSIEEFQLSRELWLGGSLYEVGLLKRGTELF